jgi:hypothetical protein
MDGRNERDVFLGEEDVLGADLDQGEVHLLQMFQSTNQMLSQIPQILLLKILFLDLLLEMTLKVLNNQDLDNLIRPILLILYQQIHFCSGELNTAINPQDIIMLQFVILN